jgi:hypothetical protein
MTEIQNGLCVFRGHNPPNGTLLEHFFVFCRLFRLLCFQLYSNISVINITNLLFSLNFLLLVNEIRKSRDHNIIKDKQAAQEKISIAFAIANESPTAV